MSRCPLQCLLEQVLSSSFGTMKMMTRRGTRKEVIEAEEPHALLATCSCAGSPGAFLDGSLQNGRGHVAAALLFCFTQSLSLSLSLLICVSYALCAPRLPLSMLSIVPNEGNSRKEDQRQREPRQPTL
ncbi:unnamed protein product [Prorocentrum cordatum]|uniref:Uncharacterized protein n=1 Tax=Prorocentrum cordatum TaxID=2364126 RepID=A0ABN9VU97_9DINO|nr:unnamed protein product [Polarella glacialis]